MSEEQWKGLKAGDFIRTKAGLPRKILKKNDKSNCIILSSCMSRNGKTTVYCNRDKYLFQRVIIKNKIPSSE